MISNKHRVNGVDAPILVTGAAGQVGGVGFKIVKLLRAKDVPVRAMVRRFDNRSEARNQIGTTLLVKRRRAFGKGRKYKIRKIKHEFGGISLDEAVGF
jgi:nucleoside-diphosphate-sugar epimerase